MVELKTDFEDVKRGEKGVIVMVFDDGEAYEVEFPQMDDRQMTHTVPSNMLKKISDVESTDIV